MNWRERKNRDEIHYVRRVSGPTSLEMGLDQVLGCFLTNIHGPDLESSTEPGGWGGMGRLNITREARIKGSRHLGSTIEILMP